MRDGWRILAGTAVLALVLTLGFSQESYGLWPLFTLLDFPGQVGRFVGFTLTQGQTAAWVLGPVHDGRAAGSAFGEVLAGGLGIALTLAAGALCLLVAPREKARRAVLLAAAAPLMLLGALPPYDVLRTPAPIVAGLVLGALALPALTSQAIEALRFLGVCFLLVPLWEMREPLFVSGQPAIDLALLERGSGMPATVWSLLGLAAAAALGIRFFGGAGSGAPAGPPAAAEAGQAG